MKQLFTPVEANRTLPLVKRIVADILEKGRERKEVAHALENPDCQARFKVLSRELKGLMRELQAIGCFYKDWDFSLGLVDFPAEIEGEDVFLCWKSDEDAVRWYHPVEAGFSGRKPIPAELLD